MVLAFLLGQLAVFSEFGGEVSVGLLLVGIAGVGIPGGVQSAGVARVVFIVAVVVFIVAVVVFIFVGIWSGAVVGVGALSLVVGALGLQSGWSFSGHFRAVFPIMRIDGLGKGAEFGESVGFVNMGDFVLDSGQEPMVQLLA